jgi:YgiT-type zinc finger domain-containing protein
MTQYGDCVYCGGAVEEKRIRIDYRYHGQLFIMEEVPAGVCLQCGENILTGAVAKKLEEMARGQKAPVTTVAVPVLKMTA